MAAFPGIKLPRLSEDDPLFGVLTDSDVGIDFATEKPKISREVSDEMRQHHSVQDTTERNERVDRIRKQVWELESNIQGQRMLPLEPAPMLTTNLDKGKGVVTDFQ